MCSLFIEKKGVTSPRFLQLTLTYMTINGENHRAAVFMDITESKLLAKVE
jgi:hypothetical protein